MHAASLQAYKTSVELHRKAHADRAAAAARRARRAGRAALENGHVEGATPPPNDPSAAAAAAAAFEAVEPIPAKLLNNAAVLHLRCGKTGEAMQLMEEAIQV